MYRTLHLASTRPPRARPDQAPPLRALHKAGGAPVSWLLGGLLGVALLPATPAASQMYRWVDEHGIVHYADSIPPRYSEKGRVRLSPDGLPVQIIPAAKTPEEIRRDRELERQRAEQQRLVDQQRAADRVLLRTFRSVDDLIMVRDGKLASIDVLIQVSRGNIRRQQDWLNALRAQAADLERAGQPVPERIRTGIANSERSITDAMALILEREHQKQEIRDIFARDLQRFLQLREITEAPDEATETGTAGTAILDNLVTCGDQAECERLWERARDYLADHATLPVETEATDVVMTAAPTQPRDIALTVSRVWHPEAGGGASIFLDVQCRTYTAGMQTCVTSDHQRVLNGFREAVQGPDARGARR